MSTESVADTCVHQWTVDYAKMAELVPQRWRQRLDIKTQVTDPVSGTFMPTLPWTHAYWNEDSPDYERDEAGEYTNSKQYRSPEGMDAFLAEHGIEVALLCGHEIRFLPTQLEQDYASALASAYNELLSEEWLSASDRMVGGIVVAIQDPEGAAEEIRKYADDPEMVTVLCYGASALPMGHEYYNPIYEAAADAGLPLTMHVTGDPLFRQTAGPKPEHYVTFDTNLAQNHMTNLISMVYQGVFQRFPDLEIVWAGQGVGWLLQTMWRSTRYYRNYEPQVPVILDREPDEYIRDHCYVTTYALGTLADDVLGPIFEMVGPENILYGSGYPTWNADTRAALPALDQKAREAVLRENARRLYGM